MDLEQQRLAAVKAAQDIIAGAKAAARDITDDERKTLEAKHLEVQKLTERIEQATKDAELLKGFDAFLKDAGPDGHDGDDGHVAGTLGEHFAKHIQKDGLVHLKNDKGSRLTIPEWLGAKAATDPNTTPAVFGTPVLTQFDRYIRRAFRRQSIADVMGSGSLGRGTNAVSYFIEGAVEGNFTTVAEGAQKPQLHFVDPTMTTDAVKKIAPFRSEELFRAMTKVTTATGLTADSIVINPTDYQKLRLSKDANGQYFGGGFFTGEYGVGGFTSTPPIWGLNTIVTAGTAAGTAIVGALQASTTVYRKGGVRVEFTKDIVTTRIEERLALAVRMPAAIVKVTLL
jgi:hypothetical protein